MGTNEELAPESYNATEAQEKLLVELQQLVQELQKTVKNPIFPYSGLDLELIMKSPISTMDKSTMLANIGIELTNEQVKLDSIIALRARAVMIEHFKKLYYLREKYRHGRVSAASAPKDVIPNTYRVDDKEIEKMVKLAQIKDEHTTPYTGFINALNLPHNKIAYEKFTENYHACVEYSINHIANAMVSLGLVSDQPVEMQKTITESINKRDSLDKQIEKEQQMLQSSGTDLTDESKQDVTSKLVARGKSDALFDQMITKVCIFNQIKSSNPEEKGALKKSEDLMAMKKGDNGMSINEAFEHKQHIDTKVVKDLVENGGINFAGIFNEGVTKFNNPPISWAHNTSDPRIDGAVAEPESKPTPQANT